MIRLFMIYTGLLCAAVLGLWFGPVDQQQVTATATDIEILPESADVPSAPVPVVVELPESAPEIAIVAPEVQIIESPEPEPAQTAAIESAPAPVDLPANPAVTPAPQEDAPEPRVAALPDEVLEPVAIAVPPPAPQAEPTPAPESPAAAEPEHAAVRPDPAPLVEPPAPVQVPTPVAEPAPRLPLDPVIEALIAQAALAAEPRSGGTYVVQPGDSLLSIARAQYGTSDAYQRIFDANRDLLPSIDAIQTGQTLRLP